VNRGVVALAIIVAAGCSVVAAPSPTPNPTASGPSVPSSPAVPTGTPTATAAGTLRIGLIAQDGLGFPSSLRLESDPSPFAHIQGRSVTVAPDGRRIAYWRVAPGTDDTAGELRTIDLTTGIESTTLLASAPERAGGIAWRSDGSALVVATASRSIPFGGVDPPPSYTRVHTIDLAAGQVHELARLELSRFYPIAWSAETKIVVGVDSGEGGIHQIYRIRENGARIAGGPIDVGYQRFEASRDGRILLGLGFAEKAITSTRPLSSSRPMHRSVSERARSSTIPTSSMRTSCRRMRSRFSSAPVHRVTTASRFGPPGWPAKVAGSGQARTRLHSRTAISSCASMRARSTSAALRRTPGLRRGFGSI
jgi:hypothetical protein